MNPDSNYDMEQQFILRMTDPSVAESLAADIDSGVAFKDNFTIEFKPEMRHSIVRYNGQVYQGRLVDLPCVIESMKTTDKRNLYKTADIGQMLVYTQGAEAGPLRGTAAYLDNRAGSRVTSMIEAGRDNREFQFLHGLTHPLKNVLRRRFRKCRKKRLVDMPQIEKEVKQLLRADLEAASVKWEVIWSSPPHTQDGVGSDTGGALADGTGSQGGSGILAASSGRKPPVGYEEEEDDEDEDGRRMYAIDRRDVFGDISSSSLSSGDSSGASSNDSDPETAGSERRRQMASHRRSQPVLNSGSRTSTSAARREQSGANAETFDHIALPFATGDASNNSADFMHLKDELAAQLLLSDSDDDAEVDIGVVGIPMTSELHDEAALQASVAARLAEEQLEAEEKVAAAGLPEDDDVEPVDIDGAEEDDDDGMPEGGELLDDATLATFTAASVSVGDHQFSGILSSDDDVL